MEKELKKQRERYSAVIDYLKTQGKSQKKICDTIGKYDEATLSGFKSGTPKYIPDDLLERLHKFYNINPLYIRLESDFMLDMEWEKFNSFVSFVDSWDTVIRGDNSYLHFTMDKAFYDFLISVDKIKLTENNFSNFEDVLKNVKDKYTKDLGTDEYVVIPKNEFIQIVKSSVEDRKQLSEVIDILEHSDYINEDF